MLITIENFGAIKYFEFDTEKDMYLIFGQNSMGKSYAISLVYLILKNIIELNNISKVLINQNFGHFEINIKQIDKRLKETNAKEIDLSEDVKKTLLVYINHFFLAKLNDSIINTFNDVNNLQNKFSKEELKIKIKWCDLGILIELGLDKALGLSELRVVNFELSQEFVLKRSKRSLNLKSYHNKFILYFPETNKNHLQTTYFKLIDILISGFINDFQSISKVYYLPASRSGLYQALSAFGQIFAELSKNRSFISKRIELPAISEPLADYFLELSNITSISKNNELFFYAKEIEKEILQGVVEFDDKTKRLNFIPNGTDLRLDLSATSSMVSEISPIVSYLKYILPNKKLSKQKSLIFIEEPEAHLHPEVQIKLIAVFARLVKDDKIKIVITSHSNYIFNKASNLVIDNKIDQKQLKSFLFRNTPEGSIAEDLETDEYGIEDNNFIDVAESLYEEKIALINKLNTQ
jgi:predicted ATPase